MSDLIFECFKLKPSSKKILSLIDSGIDINYVWEYSDNNALSAICYSNSSNKIKFIELLIEGGINVNHTNSFGDNAFAVYCFCQKKIKIQILDMLIGYGVNINNLNYIYGHVFDDIFHNKKALEFENIKFLIHNGLNISDCLFGNTVFNSIINTQKTYKTKIKIIKLLIENNININKNIDGDILSFLFAYF